MSDVFFLISRSSVVCIVGMRHIIIDRGLMAPGGPWPAPALPHECWLHNRCLKMRCSKHEFVEHVALNLMWVKQCHKPPIWDDFNPIKNGDDLGMVYGIVWIDLWLLIWKRLVSSTKKTVLSESYGPFIYLYLYIYYCHTAHTYIYMYIYIYSEDFRRFNYGL